MRETIKIIEELCEEDEIKITTLEEILGIARGSIRRWDVISPSIDKVLSVADFFDVSLDYILGRSPYKYTPDSEVKDKGLQTLTRARTKMDNAERERMDALLAFSFPTLFDDKSNDKPGSRKQQR